jgi:hypothetical protein
MLNKEFKTTITKKKEKKTFGNPSTHRATNDKAFAFVHWMVDTARTVISSCQHRRRLLLPDRTVWRLAQGDNKHDIGAAMRVPSC